MTNTQNKNHPDENIASQADPSLKSLYKVGAVTALIAALIFRRNLGAAEIPLFTGITLPGSVDGWFTLLHNNPLLGVTLLNVFDIVNYVLVAIMFFAVYVVIRKTNKNCTLLAFTLSLFGAITYTISNSALPMLSLSNQYAASTSEPQKLTLLAAGQAVLSNGYNPSAVYQNAGFYLSLLLIAIAEVMMSTIMLRSKVFSKSTVYVGIIAGAFDLAYLFGLVFVPTADVYLLGIICISSGGLFLMIWHLLIGLRMFKLSRKKKLTEVLTYG